MVKVRQYGRALLLSALVLGLNALALLAAVHARHPGHVRANITHGHPAPLRRAARANSRERDAVAQAHEVHTDEHKVIKPTRQSYSSPDLAIAASAAKLFAPEFVDAPLASAAEASLGPAPRAPGSPRGPPLS